jgi:hypothetical protein
VLDQLVRGAGAPVRAGEKIRQRARDALDDLVDHRPGGDGWEAARAADKDQLVRGEPPGAVAELLAADHGRYGKALAECSALPSRLDEQRAKAATNPVVDACNARIDALATDFARHVLLAQGAARDTSRRSEAWGEVEQADRLAGDLRQWQAVRRWLVGEDHGFDPSTPASVDGPTARSFIDVREELTGVPADERRTARDHRHKRTANFVALREGRPLPFPDVATEDELRHAQRAYSL